MRKLLDEKSHRVKEDVKYVCPNSSRTLTAQPFTITKLLLTKIISDEQNYEYLKIKVEEGENFRTGPVRTLFERVRILN